MKTPEGYEKDEIKTYLKGLGCFFFSPYMAGFGKSGVPDIVACIEGRFWGIEVKREGKVPTTIQKRRMAEIEEAGGLVVAGTAEVVIRTIETWRLKVK
jgi:Holliday junction resolvase